MLHFQDLYLFLISALIFILLEQTYLLCYIFIVVKKVVDDHSVKLKYNHELIMDS